MYEGTVYTGTSINFKGKVSSRFFITFEGFANSATPGNEQNIYIFIENMKRFLSKMFFLDSYINKPNGRRRPHRIVDSEFQNSS